MAFSLLEGFTFEIQRTLIETEFVIIVVQGYCESLRIKIFSREPIYHYTIRSNQLNRQVLLEDLN